MASIPAFAGKYGASARLVRVGDRVWPEWFRRIWSRRKAWVIVVLVDVAGDGGLEVGDGERACAGGCARRSPPPTARPVLGSNDHANILCHGRRIAQPDALVYHSFVSV